MKYFLVSNLAECLLYSKDYTGTHVPFVLNIHDFRYFDVRNIPFVTIGHFMGPKQTREFCREYLDFLRRFVEEMDLCNMTVARYLFDADIKLFSAISYEIFWTFYNVFRFMSCLHLMQVNTECEILIPFSRDYKGSTEHNWSGLTGSFYNDDRIFKVAVDYLTDLHNLSIEKVFYNASEKPILRDEKKAIQGLIRSSARKLYGIYTRFVRGKGKYDQYILNMTLDKLWSQVLNSSINIRNHDELIGVLSVDEIIENNVLVSKRSSPPENPQTRLFRTDRQQDTFIRYFRCKEFIQDLLFQRYEKALNRTIPLFRTIKNIIMANQICAVVGNACGATFINSLTSQLAQQANIPVIGMQHGGHYGYMDFFDKLGYSDYYACDYWFSWGFDNNYLQKVFHSSGAPIAKIIPVGSINISNMQKRQRKRRKKEIKIIYVMTNNVALAESTFRIDDFKLYNLQKKILETMFASHVEIMVKPHSGFKIALDDMIKNIPKNITISFDPFSEILQKCNFEWVIIDLLSTPFEEACITQAQVLVFNDTEIWSIESSARQLMEKRAWVFDDEKGFLEMLDRILADEVFDKRLDLSFERNFILPHGENTIRKAKTELFKIISEDRYAGCVRACLT